MMGKKNNWFGYAGILPLVMLAMLMLLVPPVLAQDIQVTIDGSPLHFGSVPPASVGGRVLVPLRGVFEALGAAVFYKVSTNTVFATKGDTRLTLQIGSATAYINNKPVTLDVPAQIVQGRTLVPLRFVSETIGAKVAWNPVTQTVAITRPALPTQPESKKNSTPIIANDNGPRIDLVQQNTVAPVKTGDVIKVTVRGTPGLQGTFDISQNIMNLPLREKNPGIYTGSYKVRPNDDVYRSHITAQLTPAGGNAVTQQSPNPVTIDTKAPLVVETSPSDGATVDVAQPDITIETNDQNGSGLAPTILNLSNNGQTYQVPATVAGQSICAVAPQPLSGLVQVQADVIDNAGNVTQATFSFTVSADNNPIQSIQHNAVRALTGRDMLTVDMMASPGGRASFDLVKQDAPNQVVAQDVPMVEIEARRYRGTYDVLGTRDVGTLMVVGRFRDAGGNATTKSTTTPVEIIGQRSLPAPLIKTPKNNANVTSPLIVQGTAAPHNTVQVNIHATSTQHYILPYEQDLGTFSITADANGDWHTDSINLPSPKNFLGLKFVITAVQQNDAGQTSLEATSTVQAQ